MMDLACEYDLQVLSSHVANQNNYCDTASCQLPSAIKSKFGSAADRIESLSASVVSDPNR